MIGEVVSNFFKMFTLIQVGPVPVTQTMCWDWLKLDLGLWSRPLFACFLIWSHSLPFLLFFSFFLFNYLFLWAIWSQYLFGKVPTGSFTEHICPLLRLMNLWIRKATAKTDKRQTELSLWKEEESCYFELTRQRPNSLKWYGTPFISTCSNPIGPTFLQL